MRDRASFQLEDSCSPPAETIPFATAIYESTIASSSHGKSNVLRGIVIKLNLYRV